MGRIFMTPLDDPFAVALREIEALRAKTRVIIVDFHAEATSEKIAMGWHLDGRVTAVFGTHTHVQTADERILPKGTACLTDVGMTGPHDSIIGVTVEAALGRFLTGMPAKFEAATGPARLNAVDRHRGSCHRQGHSDRTAEPVDAGGRRAGGRARCRAVIACRISSRSPSKRTPSPGRITGAARAPGLFRLRTDRRHSRRARDRLRRDLGRGRTLELPDVEHRARLLHAEGRRRADQGRDVPIGRPLSEVQAGRRHARDRSRSARACTSRKGEYQIVCEHLEPHGLGALQMAFEQLKKKLQAEGLFDAARKRPLPSLPRKIGIVTSLDGAALRDIIKVLGRRHPNAHLVIRPTRVQGEGAAADIAEALRAIVKVRWRGRGDRRAGRRLARGSARLQPGAGRARDCRLARCRSCRRSGTKST